MTSVSQLYNRALDIAAAPVERAANRIDVYACKALRWAKSRANPHSNCCYCGSHKIESPAHAFDLIDRPYLLLCRSCFENQDITDEMIETRVSERPWWLR